MPRALSKSPPPRQGIGRFASPCRSPASAASAARHRPFRRSLQQPAEFGHLSRGHHGGGRGTDVGRLSSGATEMRAAQLALTVTLLAVVLPVALAGCGKGPQGDAGPAGPQGPKGDAGADRSGGSRRATRSSRAAGQRRSAQSQRPRGQVGLHLRLHRPVRRRRSAGHGLLRADAKSGPVPGRKGASCGPVVTAANTPLVAVCVGSH